MLAARDLFDSIPGALALLLFGLLSALVNYLRNRQAQRQGTPSEHADDEEPPVARPSTARREERASRGSGRPSPEALPPVAAPPIVIELERRPELSRSQQRRAEQAAAKRLQKRLEQSRRAAQAQATQAAMQRAADAATQVATAAAMPVPKAPLRRPSIGPLDRAQLRRAIVMSEILGPPVALRDEA